MATYKQLFFQKYSNKNGNIKKGTKAVDVWNSIEEFLRLVLNPKINNSKMEKKNGKKDPQKSSKPKSKTAKVKS